MVQYDVVVRHDANKVLNNLPHGDSSRVKDAINDVATNRQPTSHHKCELMQHEGNERLYRIRVGDYRVLCTLEKPEFQVLKVTRRQGAYRDVDDVYASL